jgi:radical SAM superfamily enzyme YgiQ (UPF0313 family)
MITLVYPRTPDTLKGGISCPLGIQYIASYLEANGIKANIIDLTFTDWNDYEELLSKSKPDFIGFSIQSPIASFGLKAIELAKKASPESKIIVGGAHPTVDKDALLSNHNVDFVVIGEGEKSIVDIVQGKEKNKLVIGKPIDNLDDLPFPNRDLMNYKRYIKMSGSVEIMVSRGCPNNCIFCQPTQRKLFGDKIKMRSPENVVEEMKQIIDRYGKDFIFYFLDDTFTWNKKWLESFCLLVKPLNIYWKCLTRANAIDKEKLDMMKESGCIFINYGVKSGSQKILNFMRKGITVDQIKIAFRLTHQAGILCHAFLIIGTPTETKEDLENTISLVKEIHPDGIQISIMTPLIGTDLEKYCQDRGISNIKSLDDYHYCMNNYPINLENLTETDLKFYKDKIFKTWRSANHNNYLKYVKMLKTPRLFKFYLKVYLKHNR